MHARAPFRGGGYRVHDFTIEKRETLSITNSKLFSFHKTSLLGHYIKTNVGEMFVESSRGHNLTVNVRKNNFIH